MKSWQIARGLLLRGQREQKKILCTREYQNSISDSVMSVLEGQAKIIGIDNFYEFQNSTIYGKNGTQFIFKGLKQNVNSIKSFEDIDIVWNEEAQATSQRSIDVLYPTIRKTGAQIINSFNPNQPTDPIYIETVERYDPIDSYLCKITYLDNPFIDKDFIKRAEKIKELDVETYNHIYLGDFDNRYMGAVYGKQIAKAYELGRVVVGLYDPLLPVKTAWDLGYDDSTAIWFWQQAGAEVRLIDYYESNGEDVAHYCAVVNEKPYKYEKHYVPHDAANKLLAAGGKSIVEQASSHGVRMIVVPATSQQNSIEATRKTLGNVWIDEEKCKDGLHALKHYQFPYDEDRQTFKNHPVHDWSSHACDAVEIIGQVMQENRPVEEKKKLPVSSYQAQGNKTIGRFNIKEYIARKQREQE